MKVDNEVSAIFWRNDLFGQYSLYRNLPGLSQKESLIGKLYYDSSAEISKQWTAKLFNGVVVGDGFPSLFRARQGLEKYYAEGIRLVKTKGK